MAVIAGGKALFVQTPDYNVITWLLIYNFSVGVITILVTAILIWRNSRYALPAAVTTLGLHSVIMLGLLIGFREVVASESIQAMTIRITAWGIILSLMLLQSRRNVRLAAKKV